MKKRIPDGWMSYQPFGKKITGTNFLPFKVPLHDTICSNMAPSDRFTPSILLHEVPKLSMIVDLTNTTKYYDKEIFISQGINYNKIFCEGHVTPSDTVVQSFFDCVDEFIRTTRLRDYVIGIHCTHGINRTGYLVCRYMIDRLGMQPDVAIREFGAARGHRIERTNYLDDLRRRANQYLMKSPLDYDDEYQDNFRGSYSQRKRYSW